MAALDIIEELGFGLDRVMAAMQAETHPPPRFQETEGTFVVTLHGHGAGLLTRPDEQRESGAATGGTAERERMTPAERHTWVLHHLRTVGPLRPREYVAALGIDRKTALTDLRTLASAA